MRPLKFRAFAEGEMRYDITGFEHGDDNEMVGIFIDGDYYTLDAEKQHIHKYADVMQYTGLKDKNGKEIYEGDYDVNYDMVRWCDKRAGWAMASYDFESKEFIECHCYNCAGDFEITEDEIEIIGNIYEGETK